VHMWWLAGLIRWLAGLAIKRGARGLNHGRLLGRLQRRHYAAGMAEAKKQSKSRATIAAPAAAPTGNMYPGSSSSTGEDPASSPAATQHSPPRFGAPDLRRRENPLLSSMDQLRAAATLRPNHAARSSASDNSSTLPRHHCQRHQHHQHQRRQRYRHTTKSISIRASARLCIAENTCLTTAAPEAAMISKISQQQPVAGYSGRQLGHGLDTPDGSGGCARWAYLSASRAWRAAAWDQPPRGLMAPARAPRGRLGGPGTRHKASAGRPGVFISEEALGGASCSEHKALLGSH
jgi:hypothetical protein